MSARGRAAPSRSSASIPTCNRPFTRACLSFGGHDDRPRLDRHRRAPTRPRRRPARRTTPPSSAPGPRTGRPACSTATRRSGRATRASRRRSPSGSAGSTRRPTSPTRSPALEGFGDARPSTRASRPRSSPGWAAAASPRTSCTGRSGRARATSTLRILDSTDPAAVAATVDDLDPLRTLVHRRHEVGHDDRADRVPGRRLGAGRGGARRDRAPHLRGARAPSSRRSPIPARASRRSPTTTTSARSSSTRPTSAAGTPR